MNKRIIVLVSALLLVAGCANMGGSSNTQSFTANYAQDPDNPTVGSRAASNEEFTQENQLTPSRNQQQSQQPPQQPLLQQ